MAQCRICLEDASLNELISPCRCAGTSKYVHHTCLERWRASTPRAFSRCYECNFQYLLRFQHPMESYKFNIHGVFNDLGKYMFTLMLILISTLFMRNVAKTLHYPTLTLLNFDLPYNRTDFLEVIQDDQINGVCYFFSLNNFLASVVCYGLFVMMTFLKIKRRCLYWYLMRADFAVRILLSYHFLWLYWLLGSYSKYTFELFVVTDAGMSLFNLATLISLLNVHDIMILRMNTKYNVSRVIPPPLGSIV